MPGKGTTEGAPLILGTKPRGPGWGVGLGRAMGTPYGQAWLLGAYVTVVVGCCVGLLGMAGQWVLTAIQS